MKRRQFLIGSGITIAAGPFNQAYAQTGFEDDLQVVSPLPPLPLDLSSYANENPAPYTDTALVGTALPTTEEIEKAYDVLTNSPIGVRPVEVAEYFLEVGAGSRGQDYRSFTREWPVRANPLIYHFFSATQTKPEGDRTAWCAAFVNWCALRSRATRTDEIGMAPGAFSQTGRPFSNENLKEHSTNSASSGSFRCWPAVTPPQRGFIAVFKDADTDDLTRVCRGSGHVCFFLDVLDAERVRVLGGNQHLQGSNGAITIANAKIAPGSRFMKYVEAR